MSVKRSYYLFNGGRLSRKDNTLCFVAVDAAGVEQPAKYLPIETVGELLVFGALEANAAMFNEESSNKILAKLSFFPF